MEALEQGITWLKNIIDNFGIPVGDYTIPLKVIALLGTGLFLTVWLGFVQLRRLVHGFAVTSGRYDDPNEPGDVSHFQALTTALSATVGGFSGVMITRFRLPPFIATLGMMQVASGLAYIISKGRPIYEVPDSFVWLGRGALPGLGVPYAVVLMVVLYGAAHVVMSRTTFGRYVYAVGGNAEAARLSGVRVGAVLVAVYVLSGAMAGLGGVVLASQLKGGAPTYGLLYELYVIACVVVGGTSLAGGQGRMMGTLIGAFIIAVLQNGMNLTDVGSYAQKVVLGFVILGAVLLDQLRRMGWRRR